MKKTVMAKTLLAAALTAAMGIEASSAMAVPIIFNPFDITESSVPGAVANPALDPPITNTSAPLPPGKLTGNYTEVATFTPLTATTGTVAYSILWNAGQVTAADGSTVLASQIGPTGSLSANDYGLYATLVGTATYSTSGGITTFNIGNTGSLAVYIDPLTDSTFNAPSTGSSAWTTSNSTDDYLIATGTPQSGLGTLNPTLSTCSGGINCGSFGETSSFALTSTDQSAYWGGTQDGANYFTSPVPFYNLNFTSGQFDNFKPTGTQTIVGSLDATFGVPEPESLALLGIGLLGMVGMLRRGRKQA